MKPFIKIFSGTTVHFKRVEPQLAHWGGGGSIGSFLTILLTLPRPMESQAGRAKYTTASYYSPLFAHLSASQVFHLPPRCPAPNPPTLSNCPSSLRQTRKTAPVFCHIKTHSPEIADLGYFGTMYLPWNIFRRECSSARLVIS